MLIFIYLIGNIVVFKSTYIINGWVGGTFCPCIFVFIYIDPAHLQFFSIKLIEIYYKTKAEENLVANILKNIIHEKKR
jgi:hypothetical protein